MEFARSDDGEHALYTLFGKDVEIHTGASAAKNVPYSVAISSLGEAGGNFPLAEVSAFSQVLEHESQYYESRGFVSGPLELSLLIEQSWETRIACKEIISIPSWVEPDGLRITQCDATACIVVDSYRSFRTLLESTESELSDVLIVCTSGIARSSARRFLRRLAKECALPMFLVCDNDTWGYFHFSVIKEGMLQPGRVFDFLSVPNLKYLGLRAGDAQRFSSSCRREWKNIWTIRLQKLRSYECFAKADWMSEFEAFEQQSFAIELSSALEEYGSRTFVREVILPRVKSPDMCLD